MKELQQIKQLELQHKYYKQLIYEKEQKVTNKKLYMSHRNRYFYSFQKLYSYIIKKRNTICIKKRIEQLNKTIEQYKTKISRIEVLIQIEKTKLKREKLKNIKSSNKKFNWYLTLFIPPHNYAINTSKLFSRNFIFDFNYLIYMK